MGEAWLGFIAPPQVVPRNPPAINRWEQRARRALFLADSYPACRQILKFYSGVARWQRDAATRLTGFSSISAVLPALLDLVEQTGPPPMVSRARAWREDPAAGERRIRQYWDSPGNYSDDDFFARVTLQVYAASLPEGLDCSWCGKAPQAGCLKEQGNGQALELVCGLCLRLRPFPRTRCAGCGESSESKLASLTAEGYPHIRVMTCETCHGYLHVVDLARDPAAIPEVDDLAALPLDIWAMDSGYHKLQPNLAGV